MARLVQKRLQRELIQLIAQRCTNNAIQEHFRNEHGLEVWDGQIKYYRDSHHWQPLIQELRDKWDRELSEEFLASKRTRLRERADIYGKAKMDQDYKTANKILDSAQQEMEGRKVQLTGEGGGPIKLSLAERLKQVVSQDDSGG